MIGLIILAIIFSVFMFIGNIVLKIIDTTLSAEFAPAITEVMKK